MSNPLVLSCAKIVSFTEDTITVRSPSGVDAVFADGGNIKIDSASLVDTFVGDTRHRSVAHSTACVTVSNYRPNDDGTQTWNYRSVSGNMVAGAEMFAYYYEQV